MSLDSFMNKAYNVVNLLSLALGNETTAKRQIILSSNNEKFTIPVTPRSYEIKTAQNNETIDHCPCSREWKRSMRGNAV